MPNTSFENSEQWRYEPAHAKVKPLIGDDKKIKFFFSDTEHNLTDPSYCLPNNHIKYNFFSIYKVAQK